MIHVSRASRAARVCALSLLLMSLTALPEAVEIDPPRTASTPSFVKGHIIVKYRIRAGSAAADRYQRGRPFQASIGSASLDRLHGRHRVARAERAFTALDEALKRGRTASELAADVGARFGRRSRRTAGIERTPDLSNIYILELGAGADEEAAVADFRRDPDVEYAERDGIASAQMVPSDPYFLSSGSWGQAYPDLWALGEGKLGAAEAWDVATGQGVVVAVVDTGIDYRHPDIAPSLWTNPGELPGNGRDDDGNGFVDDVHGYDFAYSSPDPLDRFGHGTHVAGTIAAAGNNGIGVIGLAFGSKVMAVKGLDDGGSGPYSRLANAIAYAADNGADVINNSWGGPSGSSLLEDAIGYAHSLGAVVVAAAGNSAADAQLFYPARYADVITVAASDLDDHRATFSNWGSKIDVAAPGGGPGGDPELRNILSLKSELCGMCTPALVVGDRYLRQAGTSMAAPHVSALAALVLSRHPEFTNEQVRQVLRVSADDIEAPGIDLDSGHGRINAARALQVSAVPDLRASVPLQGATVDGAVTISGTAGGPTFASFQLEVGAGANPTVFTPIGEPSTTPVRDGVLGVWDTSTVPDGTYVVRLRVTDDAGRTYVSEILGLVVRNISISFPLDGDILKPGSPLEITGSVDATHPFVVDFGAGFEPAEWSTAGIVASGEAKGILATWETSGITANGFYTLRLRRDVPSGTRERLVTVYFETSLKAGWPQYVPVGPSLWADNIQDVLVADLDGDGTSELITQDSDPAREPRLLVYDHRGALSWSAGFGAGTLTRRAVAVGDIDGDGTLEIFVDVSMNGFGLVHAFHHDGTPLGGGWPVSLPTDVLSKLVADLRRDGSRELVVRSSSGLDGPQGPQSLLAIIDAQGIVLKTIWVPMDQATTFREVSPAVGNFDADPALEIVTKHGANGVAVYNLNGALVPGWPVKLNTGHIWHSLVVGDLNHDGKDDIVVAGIAEEGRTNSGLFALNRSGKPLPGWPVLTGDGSFPGIVTPALADLDLNGTLEVCVSLQDKVYVFDHRGALFPGWPQVARNRSGSVSPAVTESAAIADVNGDGRLDVVVAGQGLTPGTLRTGDLTESGGVWAWNRDGSRIDLNPAPGVDARLTEASWGFLETAPPTLADVDHDGRLDLVGSVSFTRAFARDGTSKPKERNSIYVWDLDLATAQCPSPEPAWPMFQHDPERTGHAAAASCFVAAWTASAWSACSQTCGGGTQTRTLTPAAWKPEAPDAPKPATSRACNTQACPLTCYDFPDTYATRPECLSHGWPVCERRFRDDGYGNMLTCWKGFN